MSKNALLVLFSHIQSMCIFPTFSDFAQFDHKPNYTLNMRKNHTKNLPNLLP